MGAMHTHFARQRPRSRSCRPGDRTHGPRSLVARGRLDLRRRVLDQAHAWPLPVPEELDTRLLERDPQKLDRPGAGCSRADLELLDRIRAHGRMVSEVLDAPV